MVRRRRRTGYHRSHELRGNRRPRLQTPGRNTYWHTLASLRAEGPILLAFYPGDFTPVCTKQLCAYQEIFEAFKQVGVRVVGISPNDPASHQEFRKKYQFGFTLLSDPGKEVTKLYGVTSLFMLGGTSRAVFVVNREGKVAFRHVEPTTLTHRRPAELLAKLLELRHRKVI